MVAIACGWIRSSASWMTTMSKRWPLVLFEQQHALEDPVEAIGFGGGAVVGANGEMNMRKACFKIAHSVERRIVVGIRTNEEVVVVVVDRGDVVLHHAADDGVLVPQRHEDGDLFFRLDATGIDGRGERWCFAETALDPGPQADRIQYQVVEAADQNRDSDRQQAGRYERVHREPPG